MRTTNQQLPAALYPADHEGLCYDQIGALTVGVGFAVAGPVLAAVGAAGQAALAGHWPLSLLDVLPDPAAVGISGVLSALLTAGVFMRRHWRMHRALTLVNAEIRELLADALASVAAGEMDVETYLELLAAAGIADDPDEPIGAADGPVGQKVLAA